MRIQILMAVSARPKALGVMLILISRLPWENWAHESSAFAVDAVEGVDQSSTLLPSQGMGPVSLRVSWGRGIRTKRFWRYQKGNKRAECLFLPFT